MTTAIQQSHCSAVKTAKHGDLDMSFRCGEIVDHLGVHRFMMEWPQDVIISSEPANVESSQ